MARRVEETLYFAGEHTDLTFQWGTVHGALLSGYRVAGHPVFNTHEGDEIPGMQVRTDCFRAGIVNGWSWFA